MAVVIPLCIIGKKRMIASVLRRTPPGFLRAPPAPHAVLEGAASDTVESTETEPGIPADATRW